MQTRIREFRKLRDLTLKELADKIKTTPQTVQRLETAKMSVSMGWLEKIGRALLVEPADLITSVRNGKIKFIGNIGAQGWIVSDGEQTSMSLDVPATDPVAARFQASSTNYPEGSVVIGDRYRTEDLADAHNRNCLVAVKDGKTITILIGKLIKGPNNSGWILVPLDKKHGQVRYGLEIEWAARIVMTIIYS